MADTNLSVKGGKKTVLKKFIRLTKECWDIIDLNYRPDQHTIIINELNNYTMKYKVVLCNK